MDSPSPPRRDPFAGLNCPACGYELRGLSEPRCPECGEGFDPFVLRYAVEHPPFWRNPAFWSWSAFVIVAMAFSLGLFVMFRGVAAVILACILGVGAIHWAHRNYGT